MKADKENAMEIIRAATAVERTKEAVRSGENGTILDATLKEISQNIEERAAQGWNFLTYRSWLKFGPTVVSILRKNGYTVSTWLDSENPDALCYKIEWLIE